MFIFERSPSSLDVTKKLIDLQEFMFGFQFLFKCQDLHSPHYLLASALFSRFLVRAKELEEAGFSKDLCAPSSFHQQLCQSLTRLLQIYEAETQRTQRAQDALLKSFTAQQH
jgi:hypothetical protein